MAWYTGAGDDGTTGLFGSSRRYPKCDPRLEALGALDELNACIGWCRAAAAGEAAARLESVQQSLFMLQAELAGAPKRISRTHTENIERIIRDIENALPPLTTFVLPGGTELAARLECVRTVARRAERRLAALGAGEVNAVSSESLAYLNRLSSFLFALARKENHDNGISEIVPRY